MSQTVRRPVRLRTAEDRLHYVPVHVVWEITLACNLKCHHCGSRAGRPRPHELTTAECLEVVEQLARLGTRELTLIGGEAYLRRDWTAIVRAARRHGMYCAIQTGGRNLTDRRLAAAVEAGLQGLGVSIDGLPELHDRVRGVPGSYAMAIDALRRAKARGLRTSVNTQIGAETMAQLPELMDRILAAGATHWQIQLTVAMGNAVDHDELLLQPHQLLDLMPLLARLYHEGIDRGLLMIVGNNIGYYGPYEQIWRSQEPAAAQHWSGCSAGQTTIGLESDGTVKGCPSLATATYAGGNVRDLALADIWNHAEALHFGRLRSVESLWGFCRSCYYAEVCRGGCTWTADSLFGRPGNNPYCHHRALELAKQGLRERVVKTREAADVSFATGEFELIVEPIPGCAPGGESAGERQAIPLAPPPAAGGRLVQLGRSGAGRGGRAGRTDPVAPATPAIDRRVEGEIPPRLEICHACHRHHWPGTESCPFCGADVAAAAAAHAADVRRRESLIAEVERWMEQVRRGA